MFADLSASLPPGLTAAAVAAGDAGLLLTGRGPTRLLRRSIAPLPPVAHPHVAAVAAADFDGDGQEEWFLAGDPARVLKLTPRGWQTLLTGPACVAVASLDRRGTGRHAFAAAGDRLLLHETGGRPTEVAPATGVWAGPLAGDRPDLLALGPNQLFANQADGTFQPLAAGLADPRERGTAAAWAGELVLVNAGGPTRLFERQIDGTFRDRASPALAMPGAVQVIAADFDNCGEVELVLVCPDEPCRLFRRTPDGWRLVPSGLPPATGGCMADLAADGTPDLVLVSETIGRFRMASAGRWLRVAPLTRFGAPARGAVVRLTAGGRTQTRLVDGGPHEPVAHFGLGSLSAVDAVHVGWPDGARQVVTAPPVGRTLPVRHPDAA